MTRAIERLVGYTSESNGEATEMREFLVATLFVLSFAPDREPSGGFERLRTDYERFFKSSAALEKALETEFFSSLYIERAERPEITKMIPSKRLILVRGLPGVGKTVILKRIKLDLDGQDFRFFYFDFKAITEQMQNRAPVSFQQRFQDVIYSRIFDDYVSTSDSLVKGWTLFKIRHDIGYLQFREWVLEFEKHALSTDEDWEAALERPEVEAYFRSTNVKPLLHTLLSFIKERVTYLLCVDNVDRHPIPFQAEMLAQCLDITNSVQIPVILAIREPNLKRIVNYGVLGDVLLADYLDRLKAGDEPNVPINGMDDASIQSLLSKRFQFLESHNQLESVSDFADRFERNYNVSPRDFKERFWGVFQALSKTFVENDIYDYCNHNIREVLTHHFRLISRMLHATNDYFNVERLLQNDETSNLTDLRTYLFRWLICGDPLRKPKFGGGLTNIFDKGTPNLGMLDLRILEVLFNKDRIFQENSVAIGDLESEFLRLGVRGAVLREHISALTKNEGNKELGFVWLDFALKELLKSDTHIELMPAGKYFVRSLSNSREYAFWSAISADLKDNVVSLPRFTSFDTRSDIFKLEVVHRFIERTLIPGLEHEFEFVQKYLQTPKDWEASNWQYFLKLFSIEGHLYPYRLAASVQATITHSNLSKSDIHEFSMSYLVLKRVIHEIELRQ
ncbi:MAG: ATP-binding protein [Chloroflexi bacterium]|nr:ATP-binding protein [Chloroflexota bacterium]